MNNQISENEIGIKEIAIQIKDWFAYLLLKWKIIFFVGLIGAFGGLAYSYFSKPVYTASLSFAIEDQQQGSGLSGALGLASQFGFDVGGSGGGMFVGANLIELLKSRRMVEQTLLTPILIDGKTISFAELYIQNQHWRDKWITIESLKNIQFPYNANRANFSRVQDSILGAIYQNLSKSNLNVAQKDVKIDIITIELRSNEENFAKYFTEALANEVSDFYILTKSKKARINMDILEKQTDSVRRELNGAITGVALANDNTFGLNPALNVRRTPSARRQVDVQANTAILTELIKQTELAKVSVRKETPLIQIIDTPIFPLKKEKLGKLKGIVLGGFITVIIVIFVLVVRRLLIHLTA